MGGGSGKGSDRGPCSQTAGAPDVIRPKYPNSYATYTNFMYGEIGSTFNAGPRAWPEEEATGDTAYAKMLKAYAGPPPSMQQQPPQPQPALHPAVQRLGASVGDPLGAARNAANRVA